jgi:hypothetical protein
VCSSDLLFPAYKDIIGDLKLESATRKEVDEKFGDASFEMKDRFIRFYIAMLKEAGETMSPYLTQRQSKPRKKRTAREQQSDRTTEDNSTPPSPLTNKVPEGMLEQPIFIEGGYIRFPKNITTNQVNLVEAAVTIIKAIAAQNEKGKK